MFEELELYKALGLNFMKRHAKTRYLHTVFASKFRTILYNLGITINLGMSLVHTYMGTFMLINVNCDLQTGLGLCY